MEPTYRAALSRYALLTSPGRWRFLTAATAATVALASFSTAFRQTTRPDPFRPATLAERLLYPMQANAFAQGQIIRSDLRTVFALPDGEHVWAAGTGGLLLRSTDGGRNWEKGIVVEADPGTRDRVLQARGLAPEVTGGTTDTVAPAMIDSTGPPGSMTTSLAPTARAERAADWAAWLRPRPLAAQGTAVMPGNPAVPGSRPTWGTSTTGAQQDPDMPQGTAVMPGTPADLGPEPALGASAGEAQQGTAAVQDPRITPYTATVVDVLFADSLHGWAADEDGGALVTWDGGRRWTHLPGILPGQPAIRPGAAPTPADSTAERMAAYLVRAVRPGTVPFTAMSWSSGLLGVALTDRGALMWTSDGGGDWGAGVLFAFASVAAITSAPLGGGQVAWAAGHSDDGAWSVWRSNSGAWVDLQVSRQFPPVASLVAVDSLRVLAITRDGRMLGTRDGGVTWPDTVPMAQVRDAHFAGEENGWAVGDHGTVYSTSDGGASWRRLAGGGQRLEGVDFADRRVGWAVGSGGVILATRTGGRRWSPQESGTRVALHDVHSLSNTTAVVVGANATVLRTEDGGGKWDTVGVSSVLEDGIRPDLRSVHFSDASHGWITGDYDVILATNDGGRSWRRAPAFFPGDTMFKRWFRVTDVHALDARNALVVGNQGFIARTGEGARNGVVDSTGTEADLEAVSVLVPQARSGGVGIRRWAVGTGGMVLGADSVWRRIPVPTTATLTGVRFTHPDTGWITGHDGVLLSSTDGGSSWQNLPTGMETDLLGLASAEGRTWAVGEGATILARRPGGAWVAVGRPGTWWPAPWYLATWVVVLGLVAVAARPAPPPARPAGVAGIAANDRPLDDEARDAFQLRDVSAVISRFLRNDRTDPPLTLAVTGPWGSGKTSLMNLVCADLRKHRWRPVLFNAWHHQTEEHLLAALLENVRAQAIPGPLERGGLRFRWRLFWIRFGRFRPPAIAALLFGFLYVGSLWAEPERLNDVVTAFTSQATADNAEAACNEALSTECLKFGLGLVFPDWKGLTAVVAALAFFGTAIRTVKAFGANPATLLRKAAEGTRLRSLEEQTSFRHRFAREFEEVTEALKPNDVVLFVDDLDRCRPKHVLDVLEGINFLVSSGRCVVIMGMDPERVERCVGLGFRDEAEEVADDLPPGGADADGADAGDRRKRSAFARQYLEKLVNIEVPIPPPGAHHFSMLAEGDEAPQDRKSRTLDQAARWAERHGAQTVWVAAAFGMLLLGRVLLAPSPAIQPPLVAENPAAGAGAAPAAAAQPVDTAAGVPAPAAAPLRPARPGDYIPREAEEHSTLVVWVGLALALLLAWRRLANRAEPTLQDSQAFRVALRAWAPYVARQRTTPRAFKKFLNRVRYYAMRQRAAEPSPTRWRRLLDRVTGRTHEPGLRDGSIPEEVLVALAALHECEPRKVKETATYSDFRRVVEERLDRSRLSPDDSAALAYSDSIDPTFRERFAELTVGVRVS